ENRKAVLAVIGLGYVGLPVACSFASAGFRVRGIDINSGRVRLINSSRNPIEGNEPGMAGLLEEAIESGRFQAYDNYEAVTHADVVLVAVETPVDANHVPHYEALRAACHTLGSRLKSGALV